MFKKGLIAIVLGLTLFISTAQCGEVKIMLAMGLMPYGENCLLVPQKEYYEINYMEKYSLEERKTLNDKLRNNATTLKKMISDNWKINTFQTIEHRHGRSHLFILIKD